MKDFNYQTIRQIAAFGTILCLLFSIFVTPTTAARPTAVSMPDVDPAQAEAQIKRKVRREFGALPLSFERNIGQTSESVKFLARSLGYTMFFTEAGAVIKMRGKSAEKVSENVLEINFEGANEARRIEGAGLQSNQTNYLKGAKKDWQIGAANYEKILYRELYKGIDAAFYGVQKEIEYDFLLAPGSDVGQIKLAIKGAENVSVDAEGNLVIKTETAELVQPKPFAYQEIDGRRRAVEARYVIKSGISDLKFEIGFAVGEYDRRRALTIDPKLVYSSYFGGDNNFTNVLGDEIVGIAVDSSGNTYIAGNTTSTDFVTTAGAFQSRLRQSEVCDNSLFITCGDAFVAKINPAGSALVYSTLIGGQLNDRANDLALGSDNLPVIVGATDPRIFPTCGLVDSVAVPFPTTGSNFQDAPGNFVGGCLRSTMDAFVTKLNSSGTDLIYSTFYAGRGDDIAEAVAVDSENKIYVLGLTVSPNLPTKNAFQNNLADSGSGGGDLFVAKFDPNQSGGSSFLYGSYLGGANSELATDIAVDAAGNAYVVGGTNSTDIIAKSPSNLPPIQSVNGGSSDGLIAKIDPTNASGATSLVYLTYFGGIAQDQIDAVAVEPATQRAYVFGSSNSSSGLPLLNAFDSVANGRDAFVAKLNADGTALFYSTFLGGGSIETAGGIAIDAAGNAYVAGNTRSTDFPVLNAFQTSNQGGSDAFVAKISAVPSVSVAPQILWSSLYGGSGEDDVFSLALDRKGQVYLGGATASTNLPVSAVNLSSGGIVSDDNKDGLIAKIQSTFNDSVGIYDSLNEQFRLRNPLSTGAANTTLAFGQAGEVPVVGDWNGDGQTELGVYDTVAAQFTLRRKICPTIAGCVFAAVTINFGQTGDVPVAGDWNADGLDTIGVYRPSTGQFLLADSLASNPVVTHTVNFTAAGNIVPLAGDWDGDGRDTVGLYILSETFHSTGQFRLTNQDVANPAVNISASLGTNADKPLAGDWDGDGDDTVGLMRVSTGSVRLTNNNATLTVSFTLDETGNFPLAGDWDGIP